MPKPPKKSPPAGPSAGAGRAPADSLAGASANDLVGTVPVTDPLPPVYPLPVPQWACRDCKFWGPDAAGDAGDCKVDPPTVALGLPAVPYTSPLFGYRKTVATLPACGKFAAKS